MPNDEIHVELRRRCIPEELRAETRRCLRQLLLREPQNFLITAVDTHGDLGATGPAHLPQQFGVQAINSRLTVPTNSKTAFYDKVADLLCPALIDCKGAV